VEAMRSLCFFCLISFLSFSLSAKEKLRFSTVMEAHVADVVTSILKKAYAELEIEIEVVRLPAARALVESNSGNFDGELLRMEGVERKFPSLVPIPQSIAQLEFVLFTHHSEKDARFILTSGKFQMGIELGILASEELAKSYKKVNRYESNQVMHESIEKKRTDFGIDALLDGIESIRKNKYCNVDALPGALKNVPLYHYLNIKHHHLVAPLNQVLMKQKPLELFRQAEKESFVAFKEWKKSCL
jgi:polar amino acid transport system substrate-binding protein